MASIDIRLEGVGGYSTGVYFRSEDGDISCASGGDTKGGRCATVDWQSLDAYIVGGQGFFKKLDLCGNSEAAVKELCWPIIRDHMTAEILLQVKAESYKDGYDAGRLDIQKYFRSLLGVGE